MSRSRLLAVILALVLPLAGCSRRAARIDVAPKKLKMYGIDRPQRLTARILDKKERPIEIGSANWESSNPAVAAVDAGGLVTPKSQGKATVTARFEEIHSEVPVEVVDVKAVEVSPLSLRLVGPVGTQFMLQAGVKDSKDKPVDLKPTWSSSQPGVATVSTDGLLTSVGNGPVSIVAKVGDVLGATDVVVEVRAIARLEVRPATALVRVGDSQRFEVVAYDTSGRPIEGVAALFKSSDVEVAKVSVTGEATGIKTGASTIRAVIGTVSAEATLIVN